MRVRYTDQFRESMQRILSPNIFEYLYDRSSDIRLWFKHAWQRVFRGYDDSAYWSLHDYLTDIALPVLREYRDNKSGYPMGMTERRWNTVLNKMVVAFELLHEDDWEKQHKHRKEIEEGLRYFARYYQTLWD